MEKNKSQVLDHLHEEVPSDYYDNAIKKNLLQKFWHSRRFSEVSKYLKEIKAEKILDVGCHSGLFTYFIFKKFKKSEVYGIDVSKSAISYAKKKYKNIKFSTAKGEDIPFRNDFFDLITCFEVLEHVEDPRSVIKEIKRVAKKEASFLLIVPTENLMFRIIWFFWIKLGPGRVWTHTHIQKFTGNKLDSLLEKIGFKVIERSKFLFGMLLIIHAKKT